MDIGLATVDGNPMIAPIPQENTAFHRAWISHLSDPTIPDSADWGLANFTLDNIMHRGCHVARRARTLRASSTYTPEDEQQIYLLCDQIDKDLEAWRIQPLLQQAQLEEDTYQYHAEPVDAECCFFCIIHRSQSIIACLRI